MPKQKMPICYYPTKVVLIDDNETFLNTVQKALSERNIHCITYTKPHDAIAFLDTLPKKNKFTSRYHDDTDDDNHHAHQVNFTFKPVYSEVLNQTKQSEVSIIVADYDMPTIKGDDFFSLLTTQNAAKRVMLTGEADEEMGINVLNQKLIDRFISKNSLSCIDNLYREIKQLQVAYFNDLCLPLTEHLFPDASHINQTRYFEFVDKIIRKLHIKEHYTLTNSGSKLLMDKDDNIFWLVVCTEEALQNYHDAAYYAEADDDIIHKLEKKTHVPFLFSQQELNDSPKNWHNYLHACQKIHLEGAPIYYCLIKDNDASKLTALNA